MKKAGCLSLVVIFSIAGGLLLWGITIVKQNRSFIKRVELSWQEVVSSMDTVQVSLNLIEEQRNKQWKKTKAFAQEFKTRKRYALSSERLTYSTSLFSFLEENKEFWKPNGVNSSASASNQAPFLHDLELKIIILEKKTQAFKNFSEEHKTFLNAFPHKEFIGLLKLAG